MLNKRKRNTLFCLVGKTGSGKTFLSDELVKSGFCEKIITTTSRNERVDEVNGKDYKFVSNSDFLKKLSNNEFVEYIETPNGLYGTEISELEKLYINNCVVCLTIEGVEAIKKLNYKVKIILIEGKKDKRVNELKKRDGGALSEISKERLKDEGCYNNFIKNNDCVLFVNEYDSESSINIQKLVIESLFDLTANKKVDRELIIEPINILKTGGKF